MVWRCFYAISLLTVCLIDPASCECLKKSSYSKYDDNHKVSKGDVEDDWGETKGPYKMIEGGNGGPALTKIDGGAIRGKFRKGKISGYDTGFTWYAMHEKELEEASMSYRIKFSPGFDWTKGGKLPGLCGGEGKKQSACPVGCSEVSKDRGFSTRLMWRSDGRIVTYAYYPDKPKSIRCGEDWKWSEKVQSGKWYHIRMWAKLNKAGKKDGEFKAWLDGKEVLHKTGIRYRYNSDFKISRSYITTYAGGSSVSLFAPNKDQYIWFKDFETWSGGGDSDCSSGGSSKGSSGGSSPSPSNGSGGSSSQGSVSPRGVGTQRASKDISGYVLVPEEAGWDVPGNIGKQDAEASSDASGRDRLVQYTRSCIDGCNKLSDCAGFALNVDTCWFKDSSMMGATPQYKGESDDGWTWLYAKEDAVHEQSGRSDQPSEIPLAMSTVKKFHQSACGSFTPLRPEDCSDTWNVTINWSEEVQGHRLKWWGLQLIDKHDNTATFSLTEEETGMCFYWDETKEVTEQEIESWFTATAACVKV